MKKLFTFITIVIASSMAKAELQLHSMYCSSKNLTLNLSFVANQNVAEATEPNAKGVFVFRARTSEGKRFLGREKITLNADLALDSYPFDTSLIAYTKGRARMNFNSREEMLAYLDINKPAIYFYIGKDPEVNAQVSFINPSGRSDDGRKINWSHCEFEYEDSKTLKTTETLSSYPEQKLEMTANCPRSMKEENELILEKGPVFTQQGRMDYCLMKVLNRSLARTGKTATSMNQADLKSLVYDEMAAAMKADLFERHK